MVTVNPPHVVAEYLSEIRAYGEEEGRNVTDDFEVAVYYHINVNDDYEAASAVDRTFKVVQGSQSVEIVFADQVACHNRK